MRGPLRARRAPVNHTVHGPRERRLALLALVCLSLIWGYNWVVMKVALRHIGPFQFSVVRFVLSAAALWVMARGRGHALSLPRGEVGAVVRCSLVLTANFGLMMLALGMGAVGRTAVLVYTMPFWMLLLSSRMLGEPVQRRQWGAIASSGLGLLLLVAPWRAGGNALPGVLATAAGLLWALSLVQVRQIQRRAQIGNLTISFWQVLLGGLASVVPALLVPAPAPDPAPVLIVAMVYNIVLGTVVAWWLLYYALERLSTGAAGLATLVTPVIGVLCAWLFLGERPSPIEAGGMACILGGLTLLAWRRPPR